MSESEKVVQTVLEEQEYEQLKQIADELDLSIEEAARRAITSWTEEKATHDPTDPIFQIDDDLPEEEDGPATSAARTDEYLYSSSRSSDDLDSESEDV